MRYFMHGFLAIVILLGSWSSASLAQDENTEKMKQIQAQIKELDQKMQSVSRDEYNELMERRKELMQKIEELKETQKSKATDAALPLIEYNDGLTQYRAGNYREAINKFRKAIELDGSNASFHYMVGACYQQLRDLAKARFAFEGAISTDPTYVIAYIPLAQIVAREGNESAALDYYRKAVELDTTQYKAYEGIGNIHFRARRFDQAVDAYRKAVDIMPRYGAAWIGLGRSLQSQNKHHEAIAALKKGVQYDSRSYLGYYVMAESYNTLEQYQNAIGAAQKAIDIKHNYAPAWYEKGIAQMNLGKKDQAISSLEEAKKDRSWRDRADHFIKKMQGKIQ